LCCPCCRVKALSHTSSTEREAVRDHRRRIYALGGQQADAERIGVAVPAGAAAAERQTHSVMHTSCVSSAACSA
jgi:hypothetical protein